MRPPDPLIERPEAVHPRPSSEPRWGEYELSGWWPRVAAWLIDGLIIFAGVGLGAVLLGYPVLGEETSAQYFKALGVEALVALLYLVPIMTATNGRTLGKLALGIRVVRTNRKAVGPSIALLREVMAKTVGLSLIPLLFIVDYLWPLWDRENRALHDMLAKTRVVRAQGEGLRSSN